MSADYIRKQLIQLLESGHAHASFDDIVSGFPPKLRGVRPASAPHSAWELLEHLRIAQLDILEYTRGTNYTPLKFPNDYWPSSPEPPDEKAWQESIRAFHSDLTGMRELIETAADLFAALPHTKDATAAGQALLLADHNAYHFGQLMLVRRMLE